MNIKSARKPNPPRAISAVLWLLAIFTLINGFEMFFFPSAWFYRIVPGVPDTGPFNAHLVADGGTFNLAIGAGLIAAAIDAYRHAIAVAVAAVAGIMHSILHIYSHAAGILPNHHMTTEIWGIYVPSLILTVLAISLMLQSRRAILAAPQAE